EPAVGGSSREEILRQIIFSEPKRPRQRNKAIPLDLETIVLKAMAQEPERRYATAQELADDPRRLPDHRPLRATRPTRAQLLSRWASRHRRQVLAGLAALAVVVTALVVSLVLVTLAYRSEAGERAAAQKARGDEAAQRRVAERERDTARNALYPAQLH